MFKIPLPRRVYLESEKALAVANPFGYLIAASKLCRIPSLDEAALQNVLSGGLTWFTDTFTIAEGT